MINLIRSHKKTFLISLITLVVLGSSGLGYYLQFRHRPTKADQNTPSEEKFLPIIPAAPPVSQSDSTKKQAAKQAIKAAPPKTGGGGMSSSTKTNADGSQTTSVDIGGSGAAEPAAQCGLGATSPSGICYVDEVGSYTALGSILKDYLNTLKWSNEIGSLHEIAVVDAGDTGWTGLYSAYYNASSGDITSAYGWITLNVYYYKTSPYFNDYMKLVLSHEYGHHYTLWHKWVDLNLDVGARFPDSYYAVRPLSKVNTATDYSLGWASCELEIIAEDYSYLYSGYGYHAMAGARGYPSDPGTRTWIANLASFVDSAPTISITAPAGDATLSGTATFSASATDDLGVSKVAFYINDALISEDSSGPYEISINTLEYPNGDYTLKALAYDISHNTPATISVHISN